jgi:hypothetical protein
MITFRTSTEISADRQAVVTFPPETPIGKVEMLVTISPVGYSSEARGNLRQRFGKVHSGDSHSGDNDRIDADLNGEHDHAGN